MSYSYRPCQAPIGALDSPAPRSHPEMALPGNTYYEIPTYVDHTLDGGESTNLVILNLQREICNEKWTVALGVSASHARYNRALTELQQYCNATYLT